MAKWLLGGSSSHVRSNLGSAPALEIVGALFPRAPYPEGWSSPLQVLPCSDVSQQLPPDVASVIGLTRPPSWTLSSFRSGAPRRLLVNLGLRVGVLGPLGGNPQVGSCADLICECSTQGHGCDHWCG